MVLQVSDEMIGVGLMSSVPRKARSGGLLRYMLPSAGLMGI
jgi:hypothetical protein